MHDNNSNVYLVYRYQVSNDVFPCAGTHVVQVSITTTPTSKVVLSSYCINGSQAIGTLAIVYSLMHDSDISYVLMTCLTDHVLQQTKAVELESMASNPYNISTFAVEESGLPFHRSSVKPKLYLMVQYLL